MLTLTPSTETYRSFLDSKIIIFYFTLVLKESVAVKNAPQFVWDQPDNESAFLQIEEIVPYSSAEKKRVTKTAKESPASWGCEGKENITKWAGHSFQTFIIGKIGSVAGQFNRFSVIHLTPR